MKRFFYFMANGFAAIVILMLLIDPTQPLTLVFVLLALSVVCAVVPSFLPQ